MGNATLRLANACAKTNFTARPANSSVAQEELDRAQDAVATENATEKVHAHVSQVGYTGYEKTVIGEGAQMGAMDMAHALMAPAPVKMDSVVQIAKLQFAQVNQSAMAKVSATELMESAHVNKDSLAVTVGSKLAQ